MCDCICGPIYKHSTEHMWRTPASSRVEQNMTWIWRERLLNISGWYSRTLAPGHKIAITSVRCTQNGPPQQASSRNDRFQQNRPRSAASSSTFCVVYFFSFQRTDVIFGALLLPSCYSFFFLKRCPTLAQKKLHAGLLVPVCLRLHLARRPCTWEGDVLIQLHLTILAKANIKKGYKGASNRFITLSSCFHLSPNTPPSVAKGQIRGTCRFCQEKGTWIKAIIL